MIDFRWILFSWIFVRLFPLLFIFSSFKIFFTPRTNTGVKNRSCSKKPVSLKSNFRIPMIISSLMLMQITIVRFRFITCWTKIVGQELLEPTWMIEHFATLRLHQLIQSDLQLEIARPIANWAIFNTWIFMFCYFGEVVKDQCESVGDRVYQCQWYLFPIEVRKKLPLMLAITQSPLHMQGLFNIQCTLNLFTKVIFTR